jgi:hypothetical protein
MEDNAFAELVGVEFETFFEGKVRRFKIEGVLFGNMTILQLDSGHAHFAGYDPEERTFWTISKGQRCVLYRLPL